MYFRKSLETPRTSVLNKIPPRQIEHYLGPGHAGSAQIHCIFGRKYVILTAYRQKKGNSGVYRDFVGNYGDFGEYKQKIGEIRRFRPNMKCTYASATALLMPWASVTITIYETKISNLDIVQVLKAYKTPERAHKSSK